jgi:replicative DNA helicase
MEAREFEKVFFLFIQKNPKYFTSVKPDFFRVPEIGAMYEVSKKFFERYLRAPDREQLKKVALTNEKYKGRLEESYVDIVFDEPYDSLDPDWIANTCEAWIKWTTLTSSLVDTVALVKGTKVDSDNVQDMVNRVKTIINDRNNVNFSKDLGKDFFKADSHYSENDLKISTNHNFMDRLTGGYRKKTLVVYAGESNVGKSIWLANDAVNFVRDGRNVAVISAEMSDTDFIQRIGSNLLDIDIAQYEKVAANADLMKERLYAVENAIVPPGRMFVKEYPTSVATTIDVEAYLRELESTKGVKLDVVIIDYVNILNNHRNPNSENTYMKIKQLAEDLRAMAVRNEWVVITATQFNRSGYDATEVTIANIAESAGLTHTADVIYGIIQDMSMKSNNEYWLKVLKVRNGSGKNMKCQYGINYSRMRLHETENLVEGAL